MLERDELFLPVHKRLGFLDWGPIGWLTLGIIKSGKKNTKLRLLVTKEIVELVRSGTVKKMIVSYSIPLAVLLLMAWAVDFAEAPIPVNLLSYAPFLGFFGFNYYSWLTAIDSPAHYDGLPVSVPEVIRAKVTVYFLSTTWISVIFLVLMAWNLDAWWTLPGAFIVMIANSIYIVSLTAFLMGLRPNKAIFDASYQFKLGKGKLIEQGNDLVIFATGSMVQESLVAMEELKKEKINISLVNISTIKPIDRDIIIEQSQKHNAIITAEDHNIFGGLGDAVGEVLLDKQISVPFTRIAVKDQFAETGTGPQLYEKYGLSSNHIIKAVKHTLNKK